jgi:hypothetical protein
MASPPRSPAAAAPSPAWAGIIVLIAAVRMSPARIFFDVTFSVPLIPRIGARNRRRMRLIRVRVPGCYSACALARDLSHAVFDLREWPGSVASEAEPIELQDALRMGEEHLGLLPLPARGDVVLNPGNVPGHVAAASWFERRTLRAGACRARQLTRQLGLNRLPDPNHVSAAALSPEQEWWIDEFDVIEGRSGASCRRSSIQHRRSGR